MHMRCAIRKDFEGQIASCGRELGHDGMHTGVLNDQGVQWKSSLDQPSTDSRAHLDELSESELQQRLDEPEPRAYEHSDFAAYEHVLPKPGQRVAIGRSSGEALRGTYDTALVVDTLGVHALVISAPHRYVDQPPVRKIIPWHVVTVIEIESENAQW